MDRFWGIEFGILNALNYAVDALMSVLLWRPVLLVFLQIGTAPHVRTEAWAARLGWSINLCHDDLIPRIWNDVWGRRLLTRLEMEGMCLLAKVPCESSLQLQQGFWIDRSR
jgi:hypothetical protein